MRIEDILHTSRSLSDSKKTVVSLLYTTNLVAYKLNEVLKPQEVSLEQFNVLRILRGQNGVTTLANIQARMITKMSNTTRLIDKLVLKGFVKKEINPENKRKLNLSITDSGLNVLIKLDDLINQIEIDIISNLNKKETRELNKLLEKIRLIAN